MLICSSVPSRLSLAVLRLSILCTLLFFFFNDPATTEIYTLSLHDALPISLLAATSKPPSLSFPPKSRAASSKLHRVPALPRSEEHTSELQSHSDLVCRLLLEKKKKTNKNK